MAITHADLEPGGSYRGLGTSFGNTLLAISFTLGLLAFPLCIMAEISKSQVAWTPSRGAHGTPLRCAYLGSGLLPSAYGGCALALLFSAFAIAHVYMFTALCSPPARESASPLRAWFFESPSSFHGDSKGAYQGYKASAFFIGSLYCHIPALKVWFQLMASQSLLLHIGLHLNRMSFVGALVLNLMAVSIELHHQKHWSTSHSSCLTVRKGMFTAAGAFGVACTSFGTAFYATALQTKAMQEREATMMMHEVNMQELGPPHHHQSSSSPSMNGTPLYTLPNKTLAK